MEILSSRRYLTWRVPEARDRATNNPTHRENLIFRDQIQPAFIIRAKFHASRTTRKDSLLTKDPPARPLSGTSYQHVPGWELLSPVSHVDWGRLRSKKYVIAIPEEKEGTTDWSATGQYLTSSGSRSGSNYRWLLLTVIRVTRRAFQRFSSITAVSFC